MGDGGANAAAGANDAHCERGWKMDCRRINDRTGVSVLSGNEINGVVGHACSESSN